MIADLDVPGLDALPPQDQAAVGETMGRLLQPSVHATPTRSRASTPRAPAGVTG